MALTSNQLTLVTELREAMERELARQLNDNLNNKLSAATGTGLFQLVSNHAAATIEQMQSRDPDSEGKNNA